LVVFGYIDRMQITLSFLGDIPVFHLIGRLDASTSTALEERLGLLLDDGGSRVVFDCEGLAYVSSAGLRVFITTLKSTKACGGGLALARLQNPVRELFRLAGLEELFVLAPTVDEAAERLKS
jgi:anti-sigma B factor antagonist